ncbi:unnamed protein product [Chrysoparadoxa australica]
MLRACLLMIVMAKLCRGFSLPAPSSARLLATDFAPEPPSEGDIRCIEERQLKHPVNAFHCSRCKHGYPQAFGFHPSQHRFNSGIFRLSCPLLVEQIDNIEAEGAINTMNERLQANTLLQENFKHTNAQHSSIRQSLMSDEDKERLVREWGEEAAGTFMASGISGITPNKVDDAKCLHAHTADELCRGGNEIGKSTLEALQARGVMTDGNDKCFEACRLGFTDDEGWSYVPKGNKQGLRTKNMRRKMLKARDLAKAEAAGVTIEQKVRRRGIRRVEKEG